MVEEFFKQLANSNRKSNRPGRVLMRPTGDTSSVSCHTSDYLRVVWPGLWILQGDRALRHTQAHWLRYDHKLRSQYASTQATEDGVYV